MTKNNYLGLQAEDIVTGFSGTVTGFSQYLTGCDVYLVTPKGKDKTSMPEGKWLDENRLKFKTKGKKLELETNLVQGAMDEAPVK